jgi:uncharacterized MAPEG superfamily protein
MILLLFAERRFGQRRIHRVRSRYRWCRGLRGRHKFAVLPAFETFPAFCAGIGLFLIPAGFAMARSWQPAAIALMTAIGVNFMPSWRPRTR